MTRPGGTYYLCVGNDLMSEKIRKLWRGKEIGIDRNSIRCKLMVETFYKMTKQNELDKSCHVGNDRTAGFYRDHHGPSKALLLE